MGLTIEQQKYFEDLIKENKQLKETLLKVECKAIDCEQNYKEQCSFDRIGITKQGYCAFFNPRFF